MPDNIIARHLVDYETVLGDRNLITVTVGPQLNPIILSLGKLPDYRRENSAGASFAKNKSDTPNDYRIHYCEGEDWFSVDLALTLENFHSVQPISDQEWLLVRGRSSGDKDHNAHVFGAYGESVRSFPAGDGIEDVQVTKDSKIWISYFDEGVFGDSELGRSGLVCLDHNGKQVFDFHSVCTGAAPIDDCYALNVCSNHETWLYYYTDFPVVQLVDHKVTGIWRNIPVAGSHAFAVSNENVLFAGGYNNRKDLFKVYLPTKRLKKLKPVTENGKVIKDFNAFGRSHILYLSTEKALFAVDANII
ncbi:hypothetical protein F1728_15305 [Gimesia benthica]|uniref:WD40 repeat domain-containing protein n=1 Tax=Gimesia benthica TaxID=2608982 RepID=A0A6I6AF08_9PLAN|nr:hypothetical protein [Gimesia benthica]QGQ23965.1 hypothetical protein F1728_15305 [Gimesia benthica]